MEKVINYLTGFFGGLMSVMMAVIPVTILWYVLTGGDVWGMDVITNLTALVNNFGSGGFTGLIVLILLAGFFVKEQYMYTYNIELLRVVDGDTIDAKIDLGFDVSIKKRVRFLGVDTPESRTRDLEEKARGLAAKERVKDLLEGANTIQLNSHGV